MEDLRDFHLNQDVFYDNKEYSMDLYNGRIQEIIANHDQKDPLFIYAAMQTPHLPLQVPQVRISKFMMSIMNHNFSHDFRNTLICIQRIWKKTADHFWVSIVL